MDTVDWIRANLPRLREAIRSVEKMRDSSWAVKADRAPAWQKLSDAAHFLSDAYADLSDQARSLGILDSAGNLIEPPNE